MTIPDISKSWKNNVIKIELGENLTVGGEKGIAFLADEEQGEKPAVALEITDNIDSWDPILKEIYSSVSGDVVKWAEYTMETYKPDLIYLNLMTTDEDNGNISPDEALKILKSVEQAVKVPLIVKCRGIAKKQTEVLEKLITGTKRRTLFGSVLEDNYSTMSAAAMLGDNILIAESPIDVNLAKQLNLLITQMNFPLERIIMDPLTGGLGYGLEYTYSIIERIRLQGLQSENMMTSPMICFVGEETWKVKEVKVEDENIGDREDRAIGWELSTAVSLMAAGANILVVRHPETLKTIKKLIN